MVLCSPVRPIRVRDTGASSATLGIAPTMASILQIAATIKAIEDQLEHPLRKLLSHWGCVRFDLEDTYIDFSHPNAPSPWDDAMKDYHTDCGNELYEWIVLWLWQCCVAATTEEDTLQAWPFESPSLRELQI